MCHLVDISKQDCNLFYCNGCKVASACVLIRNLKGYIRSPNGPIDVIVPFEWIEAIVNINEKALLKLLHENHIQLTQKLLDINIHDSFSIESYWGPH